MAMISIPCERSICMRTGKEEIGSCGKSGPFPSAEQQNVVDSYHRWILYGSIHHLSLRYREQKAEWSDYMEDINGTMSWKQRTQQLEFQHQLQGETRITMARSVRSRSCSA